MNLKTKLISLAGLLLLLASLPLVSARASFPSLTLSSNGSMVQAIVNNADPNSQVNFVYPTGSVVIGTTDGNGNLTANITPSTYNLSLGNPVSVIVNGTHSPSATWPSVSSGSSSGTTIYLSQNAVTLNIGQSSSVNVSNASNDISIPGNSNSASVNASLSGNLVNIYGASAGTALVTVCSASAGCANINVTVQPNGMTSAPVYLNPSSVTLTANQSQNVAISGYASGPYYVSTNSNGAAVTTAISGNNLTLTGISAGGSNITICASGGQCGSMYVTVTGSSNTNTAALALQSFSVSSNNSNGTFASAGNVLTITFSGNQPIVNPQLIVNGQNILVSGSGSGPYTASYTITGSSSGIPVTVAFANSSGTTASVAFSVGSISSAVSTPANTTTVTCPAGYTCTSGSASTPAPTTSSSASSGSYAFNNYLYMGMNNIGDSDADVVALQKRLAKDGFFSGAATGYFGAQTKAAVIAFQKAHGLSQLGVVGPSTRILLNQGI